MPKEGESDYWIDKSPFDKKLQFSNWAKIGKTIIKPIFINIQQRRSG